MANKPEITIAYGNEIQLTKDKKKNKEVFLKLSTQFREKQLRELKGAALSIFICYALHSNDNGYTWVTDKRIKKETGYSVTTKVRQKLIKLGYLYQQRLRNNKGHLKDYIYRIFQPIEKNKEFKIRGEKLYHPAAQKTYIGESPKQEKVGGLHKEEEPNSKEEEPNIVGKADKFDFQKRLKKMKASKRRDIQVIALYWNYKYFKFDNYKQYQAALKRELIPAKNLIGYSDEQIEDTMEFLENNLEVKWTLETIFKYIDEDLQDLQDRRKLNK